MDSSPCTPAAQARTQQGRQTTPLQEHVVNSLTEKLQCITVSKPRPDALHKRQQATATPASQARPRTLRRTAPDAGGQQNWPASAAKPERSAGSKGHDGLTPSRLKCINNLQEELSCGICLEICTRPCATPCGHAFCRTCMRQALQHKRQCPQCREPLPPATRWQPNVNTALWNTIQLLFPRHAAKAPPPTPPVPLAVATTANSNRTSRAAAGRQAEHRHMAEVLGLDEADRDIFAERNVFAGDAAARRSFRPPRRAGSSQPSAWPANPHIPRSSRAVPAADVSGLPMVVLDIQQNASSQTSSQSGQCRRLTRLQQQGTAGPGMVPVASRLDMLLDDIHSHTGDHTSNRLVTPTAAAAAVDRSVRPAAPAMRTRLQHNPFAAADAANTGSSQPRLAAPAANTARQAASNRQRARAAAAQRVHAAISADEDDADLHAALLASLESHNSHERSYATAATAAMQAVTHSLQKDLDHPSQLMQQRHQQQGMQQLDSSQNGLGSSLLGQIHSGRSPASIWQPDIGDLWLEAVSSRAEANDDNNSSLIDLVGSSATSQLGSRLGRRRQPTWPGRAAARPAPAPSGDAQEAHAAGSQADGLEVSQLAGTQSDGIEDMIAGLEDDEITIAGLQQRFQRQKAVPTGTAALAPAAVTAVTLTGQYIMSAAPAVADNSSLQQQQCMRPARRHGQSRVIIDDDLDSTAGISTAAKASVAGNSGAQGVNATIASAGANVTDVHGLGLAGSPDPQPLMARLVRFSSNSNRASSN